MRMSLFHPPHVRNSRRPPPPPQASANDVATPPKEGALGSRRRPPSSMASCCELSATRLVHGAYSVAVCPSPVLFSTPPSGPALRCISLSGRISVVVIIAPPLCTCTVGICVSRVELCAHGVPPPHPIRTSCATCMSGLPLWSAGSEPAGGRQPGTVWAHGFGCLHTRPRVLASASGVGASRRGLLACSACSLCRERARTQSRAVALTLRSLDLSPSPSPLPLSMICAGLHCCAGPPALWSL